ncbi:cytochrome P450 [Acuticoccus mangrovi]|uniref:Cytochrome P450 n=1 Tax=Acuticoccus mangrovi TaxID=2796142 RepID=A0A934MIA6_9HYPH|nr:cytochrome P450 [Acuticoccus mangrovi]
MIADEIDLPVGDVAVARPGHVPAERMVDLDIYRLPGSDDDFLQAWIEVADSAPARVIWTPRNGGHWVVLGGADIAHVYADHAHFSSRITLVPRKWGELYPLRPTTLDPPGHQPYRRLLTSLLSSRTVRRSAPIVRALAARVADAVRSRGACDVVADYAAALPFALFAGLAGIEAARMDALPGYAAHLLADEGTDLAEPVMDRFAAFLRALIAERRAMPGDDIISELLAGRIDGRPIDDDEAVDVATALLTGGLDTVVSLFAMMMRHLARDDALRDTLVADPALLPAAVREMTRRFAIMTKARLVRADQVLDGVTLKAGDMVVMPPLHGLDPAIFPDPLRVDLDRPAAPHSTYGNGVHRCPGAQLAEAEIVIMLEEWLARIPQFTLDPDRPTRMQGGVLGTVVTCHLRWDTATTAP